MSKKEESPESEALKALRKNKAGLSITELVRETGLTRSAIRTLVARLEGSGKIKLRKVGIAKVYYVPERAKK